MPIVKAEVTTSPTQLLPAGSRAWWFLENASDTDIAIAFEGTTNPTVASGARPGITIASGTGKLVGGKNGSWGKEVDNAIYGLHAGSGSKYITIHYAQV